MTTIRKRSEILKEVEELAELAMDVNPDLTLEAARSAVWEEFPEMYEEYVTSQPEPSPQPLTKSTRVRTVADACADAVHAEADRLFLNLSEPRSVEEIRADLWLSRDGEKLIELSRSDAGRQPYGYGAINKSLAYADAWAVLRDWLR